MSTPICDLSMRKELSIICHSVQDPTNPETQQKPIEKKGGEYAFCLGAAEFIFIVWLQGPKVKSPVGHRRGKCRGA